MSSELHRVHCSHCGWATRRTWVDCECDGEYGCKCGARVQFGRCNRCGSEMRLSADIREEAAVEALVAGAMTPDERRNRAKVLRAEAARLSSRVDILTKLVDIARRREAQCRAETSRKAAEPLETSADIPSRTQE